jgi:chemotaxis-related protein WspD
MSAQLTRVEGSDNACWRHIGIHGDGTCPELAQYVHCRNCPVHAQAGRALLDRVPPSGYQEGLADGMAAEPEALVRGTRTVLLFRVAEEWFAIDTRAIREVVSDRRSHTLPHHPEPAVLGLANVRGTLEISVSLQRLLGLDVRPGQEDVSTKLSRVLVLTRQGETFACPVDEVAGILSIAPENIGAIPVTLARTDRQNVEGVITTEQGPAGLLDAEHLFLELSSRIFR